MKKISVISPNTFFDQGLKEDSFISDETEIYCTYFRTLAA